MTGTPPGWNTNLTHYAHFWGSALGKSNTKAKSQMRDIRANVAGTWGSADDPLGSHTPMAQNAILKRLAKLSAGRIDDWESLVDPRLSPGENYQNLLESGGKLPAEEKRAVEKAIAETVDEREQSRAAELLREHAAAIESGDKQQLADDIADEYGQAFVSETLRELRDSQETAAETTIEAPKPTETTAEPVEATAEPTPEPTETPTEAKIDTPETPKATETATESVEATAEPIPEPATAADSSPKLGLLAGFLQIIITLFRAGESTGRNRPTASGQTTLNDY